MHRFIFTLLLVLHSMVLSSETREVLFIGNSYTYYNNLPGLINEVDIQKTISQTKEKIVLYPTVTRGDITIKNRTKQQTQIDIYSINGERVLTQNTSFEELKIGMTSFRKGVYYVKVTNAESSQTFNVLKI